MSDFVTVRRDAFGVAGFAGVQTCGSVWACAVCSAAIREEKSERIQRWSTLAMGKRYSIDYVVLTMPHRGTDRLDVLMGIQSRAWRSIVGSRWWREAIPLGLVGAARAIEITDGFPNGWHPHVNLLVVFRPGTSAAVRDTIRSMLAEAWCDAVEREGGRRPSIDPTRPADRAKGEFLCSPGVTIKSVYMRGGVAQIGDYVAKVQDGFDESPGWVHSSWGIGREMARADVKGAGVKNKRARRWSPFALAEAAGHGERQAAARWREYCEATKGKRCIEESRSASWKAFLADIGMDELTAEDVTPDAEGQVVAELSHGEWRAVARFAAQQRVLDAAETRGLTGVLAVLSVCRRREAFEDARQARRDQRSGRS